MLYKSKLSAWRQSRGINTSPMRIAVFGDSITRACSKNSLDPERLATSITKANPGVITQTGRLMVAGNDCFIWGAKGMTQLNETVQPVTAVGTNTATIGDTSAFGTHNADSGYPIQEKGAVLTHLCQGYTSGLNAFTGQRYSFNPRHNRGYSGDTSLMMDQRKEVSIGTLINDVDIVIVLPGTNDIGTTSLVTPRSNTDIMVNVTSIVNYITQTMGKLCVLGDVPPSTDNTTAQKDQREALNLLYDTLEGPNVVRWRFYSDVTTAGRGMKGGPVDTSDGAHFNAWTGPIASRRLAECLYSRFGRKDWVLNAGNLLLNPTLAGTGGTLSGVLATNNGIAPSWTITGVGNGAQSTKVARKNAVTDGQEMEVNCGSGLTTGERIHLSQTVSSGLVVGTKYVAEALVEVNSTSSTGAWYELSCELRNQSSVFSTDNHRRAQDSMNIQEFVDLTTGGRFLHFKTLPIEYLSGWTALQLRINSGHNCVSLTSAGKITVRAAQVYPV